MRVAGSLVASDIEIAGDLTLLPLFMVTELSPVIILWNTTDGGVVGEHMVMEERRELDEKPLIGDLLNDCPCCCCWW